MQIELLYKRFAGSISITWILINNNYMEQTIFSWVVLHSFTLVLTVFWPRFLDNNAFKLLLLLIFNNIFWEILTLKKLEADGKVVPN